MKKILLIIVITFMSVAQVNADTAISFEDFTQEECSTTTLNYSQYKYPDYYTNGTLYYDNGLFYKSGGFFYKRYILLSADQIYYVIGNNTYNFNLLFFDTNFNYISSLDVPITVASRGTPFTTPNSSNGYVYMFYSISNSFNFYFFNEEPPRSGWTSMPLESTECPIIEELPTEPDIGGDIIPDTTLTDFYSLFTDRLSFLSQYALENKFILSAICILLSFICLELLIYLFKGGRR